MTRVIGVDANHDSVTRAVSRHRAKQVYPYFVGKGFEVTPFRGKRAARSLVAPAAAESDVVYLTGAGHGQFNQFAGQDDLPVFQIGQYEAAEVREKVVHFVSCLTARGLGQDFVANGTIAFFGYDDNFAFDSQSRVACLDCDAEIDRGFADGLSAGEVYDRALAAFTEQISLARRAGKSYAASTLENNRDHLCAPSVDSQLGHQDARISPTRR